MARLLPDASPRTLTIATLLGAASSSCSYAAVTVARSVIKRVETLLPAMAFRFAATNLSVGGPDVDMDRLAVGGGVVGGPLMIIALTLLFKFLLRPLSSGKP